MTNSAGRDDTIVLRRFAFSIVISACAHAVVLANMAIAPGFNDLGLFAASGPPITARLLPALTEISSTEAEKVADSSSRRSDIDPLPLPAAAARRAKKEEPGGSLPSAEIYFPSGELDERAMPLNEVNLLYPKSALEAGMSGKVILRLRIDHLGKLQQVEVVSAEPPGIFDEAAVKAASGLSFRPAMRNGVRVGSMKLIEVPFDPDCQHTGSCIVGPGNPAAQP